jgi:L-2,4-diaminobutyrate decarboxylase
MNDFPSDARMVGEALERYRRESISRERPVINQPPLGKLVEELGLQRHVMEGDLAGEEFSLFVEKYLDSTTRLHHPAYLAHQVAVPHSAGSLAAMIDGFTNNAMAIYEMGPAAAAIEFFILNWMISKIGWKPAPYPGEADGGGAHAGGALTHGGSLANLTALIAARSRAVPGIWEEGNPGNLALLAPAESHYSIARAAGILGIGGKSVYPLPVDARGVIKADEIPAVLDRAQADGKKPIALVANACSTALGLYDPLREIAEACRGRVWLHVDGAHGAAALVSPRLRRLLDGIEMADSVVWDAHKLMRAPTLCAAVLVKDARAIDGAFQQEASYLFHEKEQPGFDFIHRTVECTKAGLGLRFLAVLGAMGEKGLARYVESRTELAREAHRYISGQPEFECPAEPQSNILCFRLKGSDELQLSVRDALIGRGDFYLSTATVGGRRHLRAVFMNPETSMTDVKMLVERIRETASPFTM